MYDNGIRYIGLDKIADEKQREIVKRVIKKHYKQTPPCEIRPLTEAIRIHYDYDDEYWTEYGFLRGTDYTDDEIREALDEMRYRIYSPYDCTGKPFTMWIEWHRNPSGLISYIHRVGLDV